MLDKIRYIIYQTYQKIKKYIRKLIVPAHKKVGEFYVQKIVVKRNENRFHFFLKYCKDKTVIHFGCVDWPIFNEKNNLHIDLSSYTRKLDGFDVDKKGLLKLKQYVDEDYYSNFKDLSDKYYDVCLVPETIEHVDNVKKFLKKLSKVNAEKFLITAPNCFAKGRHRRNLMKRDYFIELVHPDHNCWYSPYTLKNQIEKYGGFRVVNVYLLENERMVCCEAEKNL